MKSHPRCWTTGLLVSFCLPAAASAEVLYKFTDLGTLGGSTSTALGINDAGQVVGGSNLAGDTQYHAFIYDSRTGMQDLGGFGKPASIGFGINNTGQVTGYCYDDVEYRAFATNPTRDLGTLASGNTEAYAINDSGVIVGTSKGPAGDWHLFSYSGTGPMRDLGSLVGRRIAPAINNSSQIAGTWQNASGKLHAFRTAPDGDLTTAVDLGTLGGASDSSYAYAINDAGMVVGSSSVTYVINGHSFSGEHAFLWPGSGGLVDIAPASHEYHTYSQALGINNVGQVVGFYGSPGHFEHAFIYENGTMRDLNSLVSLPQYWTLNRAYAINETGQIVGFWSPDAYVNYTKMRAFLLTPIPEPATLGLIAFGSVCVVHVHANHRRTKGQAPSL